MLYFILILLNFIFFVQTSEALKYGEEISDAELRVFIQDTNRNPDIMVKLRNYKMPRGYEGKTNRTLDLLQMAYYGPYLTANTQKELNAVFLERHPNWKKDNGQDTPPLWRAQLTQADAIGRLAYFFGQRGYVPYGKNCAAYREQILGALHGKIISGWFLGAHENAQGAIRAHIKNAYVNMAIIKGDMGEHGLYEGEEILLGEAWGSLWAAKKTYNNKSILVYMAYLLARKKYVPNGHTPETAYEEGRRLWNKYLEGAKRKEASGASSEEENDSEESALPVKLEESRSIKLEEEFGSFDQGEPRFSSSAEPEDKGFMDGLKAALKEEFEQKEEDLGDPDSGDGGNSGENGNGEEGSGNEKLEEDLEREEAAEVLESAEPPSRKSHKKRRLVLSSDEEEQDDDFKAVAESDEESVVKPSKKGKEKKLRQKNKRDDAPGSQSKKPRTYFHPEKMKQNDKIRKYVKDNKEVSDAFLRTAWDNWQEELQKEKKKDTVTQKLGNGETRNRFIGRKFFELLSSHADLEFEFTSQDMVKPFINDYLKDLGFNLKHPILCTTLIQEDEVWSREFIGTLSKKKLSMIKIAEEILKEKRPDLTPEELQIESKLGASYVQRFMNNHEEIEKKIKKHPFLEGLQERVEDIIEEFKKAKDKVDKDPSLHVHKRKGKYNKKVHETAIFSARKEALKKFIKTNFPQEVATQENIESFFEEGQRFYKFLNRLKQERGFE